MLAEYFSIHITEDGVIQSLPQLVDHYVPPLQHLPMFVLRLGLEVQSQM